MGFFSFINKQLPAIGTLLVIACFGLIYFLIYLPQHEKNIREQRFRALQNLDRNIHDKIENSKKLLENLLDDYPSDSKYITNFPRDKFVLSATSMSRKEFIASLKDDVSEKVTDKKKLQLEDSCNVIIDSVTNKVILFCRSLRNRRSDSSYYETRMSFSFEQFFGSLLLSYADIFDHFVISKDKKVIFQDFPAGIKEIQEDSLLDAKRGNRFSGMHDINLSGTDYKIFSQPINLGEQFIVNGLVSNHRFQREKKQLPTQIILSLIILVVVIILLFPWIKLVHMGSKDRLTLWDAIATLSASMLLMSFLFLSFLNYNAHSAGKTESSQKAALADRITDSFRAEIHDIYNRLKFFDSMRREYSLTYSYMMIGNHTVAAFDGNRQNLREGKTVDSAMRTVDNSIIANSSNQAIKYVYWLDSVGREKAIWTRDSSLAPHGKYNERAYFQKIIVNNAYYANDTDQFYLDQIISWITGDFRSVISMHSKNNDSVKVAATTFDMESLTNMVLPPGFLFAMVNDSGKVLYHSESFRNLNENLLDEFSNQDKLRSCLIAHKTSSFKTDYFSTRYSVYVKPIIGLPYFIVIMEDAAYEQTRDTNIFSFSLSLLFFFFLFLTLQTFIIYLVAPKKSFFKKQLFDATWIGPKKNNKLDYVAASIFNIALILLLIVLPPSTTFLGYLFILLFSATSSPLFLNYLYARRYNKKNHDHYVIKRKVIDCFLLIILFVDLVSFVLLDAPSISRIINYEVLVLFIGLCIYITFEPQAFKEDRLSPVITRQVSLLSKDSFSFMALTRLAITSAIPIVFFYVSSYNYEENISTRNRQSLFLTRVTEKLAAKWANNQRTDSNNAIYYDGMVVQNPSGPITSEPKRDSFTDEQTRAATLLRQFRLNLTSESVSEEHFDEPSSDDGIFVYNNPPNGAFRRTATTFRRGNKPDEYLYVSSGNFNYSFPRILSREGGLFWICLAVWLIFFFFIIRGIVKKMFALQVPDLTRAAAFDEELFKNQNLNKLVFVVGPPGAGKTNFIRQLVNRKTIQSVEGKDVDFTPQGTCNRAVIADMIHIPDSSNDKQDNMQWTGYSKTIVDDKEIKLVVVNHFEYNIQDPTTNRMKLNFLEKLMVDEKRKIIILSTIHPVAFLDSTFFDPNKQTSITGKKNKKDEEGKSDKAMPEDLERWHVLLGHYRIVLMRLDEKSRFPEKATAEQVKLAQKHKLEKMTLQRINMPAQKIISYESKWGRFLNQLQPAAIAAALETNQKTPDNSPSGDEWAFKMQTTSYYFYMYIWQSLTREEKFLLYDLAEDNLVNSSDDYNLSMLIGKGLIIRDVDDTLKIFNDGFRNFILTAIGNTEMTKIKDQIRENGYWAKLKTPLRIIIVAILAFILASQEESYTRLIAYFTALAGGIPIILRIFSLFSKGSQQSS